MVHRKNRDLSERVVELEQALEDRERLHAEAQRTIGLLNDRISELTKAKDRLSTELRAELARSSSPIRELRTRLLNEDGLSPKTLRSVDLEDT